MYGLGDYEDRVLSTMPRNLRAATAFALRDPASRPEVIAILRSRDPVGSMAREVDAAIKESFAEAGYPVAGMSGLDAGMGKSLKSRLKKAVKSVVSTVKEVHDKIEDKIIPSSVKKVMDKVQDKVSDVAKKVVAPVKKIDEKIKKVVKKVGQKASKVVKRVWVKYGSTIILVVGAIAAPFTAGASLAIAVAVSAAAAVVSAGNTLYQQKRAADKAVKAGEKDAELITAQVQQSEAELHRQADEIYSKYPEVFQSLGITPTRWHALSIDAKVAIIDALSRGELPPGYSYVSEEEAAAAGATGAVAPQDGGGAAQPPSGSAPASPTNWGSIASDVAQQCMIEPWLCPKDSPEYLKWVGNQPPPTGAESKYTSHYKTYVEGKLVGDSTSMAAAEEIARQLSSPGDRIEIMVEAPGTRMAPVSKGLKLRTASGLMDVPADVEQKVRAMSHEEAVALAQRAAGEASTGAPKAGFSWWWLLAIPAVAVAAKSA